MRTIKRLIREGLENLSVIPYKVNTLDTGCYVKHYRNGKLIADKRVKRKRNK